MAKRMMVVPKRRKREGRTDYQKRLRLLQARTTRVIIRKSLNSVVLQLAQFNAQGDKILATVNSGVLANYGWQFKKNNLPACYLAGFLLGKKAKQLGITHAIVDIGLFTSVQGSKLYATVKGLLDAGVAVPHDAAVLPSLERLTGTHIEAYFRMLQQKQPVQQSYQFQQYKEKAVDVLKIAEQFAAVKKKIENNQVMKK